MPEKKKENKNQLKFVQAHLVSLFTVMFQLWLAALK